MEERAKVVKTEILSDNYYTLKRVTVEYTRTDGRVETQVREAFDRGNGAAILLYQPDRRMVLLTRQFRLPAFISGHPSGMLIEVCAGMMDESDPVKTIIRETLEETGYRLTQVERLFEAYTSPGAVTEKMHFFMGAYDASMKEEEGGGAFEEQEDIQLVEMDIWDALKKVRSGEIEDAKTIVLLQHYALSLLQEGRE